MTRKSLRTKRIFSIILSLAVALTMMPMSALAVGDVAVQAEGNVAEVTISGGTPAQYADIVAAFAAAQGAKSATVKLLKNVMIPKDDRGNSYGIQLKSGNITLDLNGCTIQTADGASGFIQRDAVFYINDGSSLTVQDSSTGGKIVQPNGGQAIHVGGALTVESGVTIEVTSNDESSFSSSASITDQNCAVFLNGGGTANILGGTLTGKQGIYVKNGTLSVSGGTIHGKNSYALQVAQNAVANYNSMVTLTGGSYTTGVENGCSIWNADGTAAALLDNGYRFESGGSESKYSDDTHGVVGDTTVAVRPANEFAYMGADDTMQTKANCSLLTEAGFTGAQADTTTWFAANTSFTADDLLLVRGTVNLILCDGVTVTLNKGIALNGKYTKPATLNIYAQSGGTGKLICSGQSDSGRAGIYDNSARDGNETALNIYGGVITATGTSNSLAPGSPLCGAGIGSIANYGYKSTMTVNISGGTVTAKSGGEGAHAIGNGAYAKGTVNVTIAPGMKCVKTDDPNTACDPGNTDGTSVTVTKCEDHVWKYTYTEDSSTHTKTCKLCGADGGSKEHTYENWTPDVSDNTKHIGTCVCGAEKSEAHTLGLVPNADGLTHKASCNRCSWTSPDEQHTFGENGDCVCGIRKSAEYNGTVYASLQAAVNAAAASGGTVTLARDVSENVTVTGGTLTVDLNGKTWHVYEDVNSNIIQKTPLTVTGGSVTLKNGTISQELRTNGKCGIQITGGRVTVEGDAVVIGSNKDGSAQLPPAPAIELENGGLTLATGATLVYGLKVPEGKHLSDYLPEGTAFRLRSYNEATGTLTKDNGLLNAYTINNYAEHDMALVVVEHTKHEFARNSDGKYVCACGYTCPHNDFKDGKCTICGNGCAHTNVDENGLCRNCKTQMAVKSETGGTVTYGTDFAAAMRNATNGTKITLLADVSISGRTGISGDNTTVTLDLNEHKITSGWLDVGGKDTNGTYTACTLKIIGKGSYEPPMYGGIITVDMKATLDLSEWEGGTISSINISDNSNYEAATREAAVIVGPKAGTIGKLTFGNNQLGELKKTKLSGGSFNEIWAADFGPVKLGELLAEGYAYQYTDGVDRFVEYTKTLQGESIYNVKVVKCPHSGDANLDTDGSYKCVYCNTVVTAKVSRGEANAYYPTLAEALTHAVAGDTVTLLAAPTGNYTITKAITLDMNGFSMGEVTCSDAGVKIQDSGSTTKGTITKLTVTGDVTLASLLPEGYAFKSGSTWISDLRGTELTNVSMAKIPIKSMDYPTEMSMTYGGAGTLLVKVEKETGTGAVSFQWYKVEDGKETAVGSATAKNQFDLAAQNLSAGQHTFRFSATCDGYKKMSQDIAVTVQRANIRSNLITSPTAQENLTYTGQEQALITAGSVANYGTMQYSLTENGTYSQNIPTCTDAGEYTVWYRVIGDANHNDTVPASVAVSIGKKPLTITGVTAASKPYDGTTDAGITSVTFDGVNLNRDTDYTVTASFDDASAGNGKNVTAIVTLMGQTAKNYALEQSSFTTTGSITKVAAPDFTKETALTIVNDCEKTYTVTLPALPTLETPKEYGALTYELGEIKLNDGYYTSGAKVENGKLTLPIQKNDVETTGSVGTVTVVIKSTNYADITLTVNVNATNKLVPTVTPPTANALTYNGAEQALVTAGKTTGGTMLYRLGDSEWSEQLPTAKNAGEYTVWYKVQGDTEYADVAEQSLPVTVAKKAVTVTALDKSAYTGSTAPDLSSPKADKDYKVEGLIGADTLSGTVTLAYEQTPDMSKTGKTAINITGTLSNDNYEITYVPGTLTVSNQPSSGGGGIVIPVQKPEITTGDGGKTDLSDDGTTIKITPDEGKEVDKVLVNGKDIGAVTEVKDLKPGDKVEVIFKDKIKEPTKEELDSKVKEALNDMTLKARSAKTSKKNIRINVIASLTDKLPDGYTVKYKYYRSTKKASGYRFMTAKNENYYINTKGTKGTRYYYKVRIAVYDNDGKLIAQTELKQCKYAERVWAKQSKSK